MKVQALIKGLQKLPKDADIILSADSEGNGHAHIDGLEKVTDTIFILYPEHEVFEIDDLLEERDFGRCGKCDKILPIGRGEEFGWHKELSEWHCLACQKPYGDKPYV